MQMEKNLNLIFCRQRVLFSISSDSRTEFLLFRINLTYRDHMINKKNSKHVQIIFLLLFSLRWLPHRCSELQNSQLESIHRRRFESV